MILNIKTASEQQIPQIMDACSSWLSEKHLSTAPDEAFFLRCIHSSLLVAVVTCDKIVKGVCVCEDTPIPDSCEISIIHISDDHRGQGLGRKLLSHSLREMRAKRFKKAFIWLDGTNERAAAFLKRIGFEEDGKKRRGTDGTTFQTRFRIDI